jgi:origin recognition complex subunit 1
MLTNIITAEMTPFQRARAVLHVAATPDYLPCREDEFAEIEAYLEDAIDEGTGCCICKPQSRYEILAHDAKRAADVAGVPGTGKTATVNSVVRMLQQRAADKVCRMFRSTECLSS